MTTANKILDFLVKRFPDTYITLDTYLKVLPYGDRVTLYRVYIANYTGFTHSPFSKEFKTIKELGEYIKEHFKDK